jgi:hypothetical protein
VGPQYRTCFMSSNWRLEFNDSSPPPWRNIYSGPGPPHYRGFTITFRHTTLRRTPLDEWSARRRDLYLTTHNTHNKQTSMPPVGFEPAIPASERPPTYTLDRAATGMGAVVLIVYEFGQIVDRLTNLLRVWSMCCRALCDFNIPVLVLIMYPVYWAFDCCYTFILISLIDSAHPVCKPYERFVCCL